MWSSAGAITPEDVGKMFRSYDLDIIGFCEVPNGDWTDRVGRVLGMKYSYVGEISSANHKDKYKTILSRTPIENAEEYRLTVSLGWNPASAVGAVTKINGVQISFYSLHICSSGENDGHAYKLATEVLPKETTGRIVVVGDFNNKIGDAAMKTIEAAGMQPIWKDLGVDVSKHYTYNAFVPKKSLGVIDHILYNTASDARAVGGYYRIREAFVGSQAYLGRNSISHGSNKTRETLTQKDIVNNCVNLTKTAAPFLAGYAYVGHV